MRISLPETASYEAYIAQLRERRIINISSLIRERLAGDLPMNLTETLARLDKLKGWLDSFRPLPPSVVAELERLYAVRFTYHSNAIEGNTLTQSETELILEKGITVGGKTLVEHLEVIGHKDAMEYVAELAQTETPIGEWEIRQIHALILRTIDQVLGQAEAGRYRILDVMAAGTEHVYPPHYEIPERMEQFVQWMASEEAIGLHPVIRASEIHYRFVSIHPFRDGNGRTGRLLMNLSLLRHGYPIAVVTNQTRKRYIDSLVYAQENADDLHDLTLLVAEASQDSLLDYLRVVSTAAESAGRGLPFYQEMLDFLAARLP